MQSSEDEFLSTLRNSNENVARSSLRRKRSSRVSPSKPNTQVSPFARAAMEYRNNAVNSVKSEDEKVSDSEQFAEADIHNFPGVLEESTISYLQRRKRGTFIPDMSYEDISEDTDKPLARAKQRIAKLGPEPENLSKQARKRRHLFQELLSNEQNYIFSLERLLQYQDYLLESRPPIIDHESIHLIFAHIKPILQDHWSAQIALGIDANEWDKEEKCGNTISAAFSKDKVYMNYSEYINHQSYAVARYKQLEEKRPAFKEFLHMRQNLYSADKQSLESLLMKPVQRFPQLLMLLENLLKQCPVGHVDRIALQMAIQKLDKLATKLNESKGREEIIRDLNQLQQSVETNKDMFKKCLYGDLAYVRQDEIFAWNVTDDPNNSRPKKKKIVLLTDRLICLTQQKSWFNNNGNEKFLISWHIPINQISIMSAEYAFRNGLMSGVPSKLLGERDNIQQDISHIEEIQNIVRKLNYSYKTLSVDNVVSTFHKALDMLKNTEGKIKVAGSTEVAVKLNFKSGNKLLTLAFDTKEECTGWSNDLSLVQLSNQPYNSTFPPWYENPDDILPIHLLPLIRSIISHPFIEQPHLQPVCALAIDDPPKVCDFGQHVGICMGIVWLFASAPGETFVRTVSVCDDSVHNTGWFRAVDSLVHCAVSVPGLKVGNEVKAYKDVIQKINNDPKHTQSIRSKLLTQTSVWIGTETMGIVVFGVNSKTGLGSRLFHLDTDSLPVTAILYSKGKICAGMKNGALYIFSRITSKEKLGVWNKTPCKLRLSVSPVTNIVRCDGSDYLWCSAGNKIHVVNFTSEKKDYTITVCDDDSQRVVKCMATMGVCVWVSLSRSSNILLYHSESREVLNETSTTRSLGLLDGDLAINVRKRSATPSAIYNIGNYEITAMLSMPGNFWVGTSHGFIISYEASKFGVIPEIRIPKVSSYVHGGPVCVLTAIDIATTQEELKIDPGTPDASINEIIDEFTTSMKPLQDKKRRSTHMRKYSRARAPRYDDSDEDDDDFMNEARSKSFLYLDEVDPSSHEMSEEMSISSTKIEAKLIRAFPVLSVSNKSDNQSLLHMTSHVMSVGNGAFRHSQRRGQDKDEHFTTGIFWQMRKSIQ